MGYSEDIFEQQYMEAMQHDHELQVASNFLMSQGWIVIPPDKIGKFTGKYKIVPDNHPEECNEDEIPF